MLFWFLGSVLILLNVSCTNPLSGVEAHEVQQVEPASPRLLENSNHFVLIIQPDSGGVITNSHHHEIAKLEAKDPYVFEIINMDLDSNYRFVRWIGTDGIEFYNARHSRTGVRITKNGVISCELQIAK